MWSKNVNRRVFFVLLFAICVASLVFAGGACAQESNSADSGNYETIVILHTNDVHGHLIPFVDKKLDDKNPTGGSAYIAALVKKIRQEYPGAVLLLDGGDIAQGTPVSNIYHGKPVVEIMNYMGYDAMTLGNHEFDWSQTALSQMKKLAKFPMLTANIVYKDNPKRTLMDMKPYIIKKVGNVRVGVIGLTTTSTPGITRASNVSGLRFLGPNRVLKRYIPLMKKDGADLIVVLSHDGYPSDVKVAEKIKGIDVIVGGHTHTVLNNTSKIEDTLIVQAGCYGSYLGRLELKIDPKTKKIVSYTEKNELIPVEHKGLTPDPEVQKIIEKYESRIRAQMDRVIGEAVDDLPRKVSKDSGRGDSSLGDLICDSMRAEAKADIALYNSGGIRADLNKGPVTVGDMYTVLPFDNVLVRAEITGADILRALEHGASADKLLQVSGLTCKIDLTQPSGQRVSEVVINGKPLEPEKMYSVATVDFLYMGGDGFGDAFKNAKKVEYGDDARSIFSQYVAKIKTLKSQDIRVTLVR